MTINRNEVQSILSKASLLINERSGHGDNTFQVMADLASIYLGQQIKPHDAAMLMALFKIARILAGKHNEDNYIDAINYLALALEQHPRVLKMNKISIDWVDLLHDIMLHGSDQPSREGLTKELLNKKLEYTIFNSILEVPLRKINTNFIAEEAAYAISGAIEPSTKILKKILAAWINEFGIYSGSYGPQFLGQLDYILETLKRDPTSRQAVMTIWKENPRPQLNVPCLTQMHFLSRENKLNCFATLRSSDAYLGLPNDIGVFALMTSYIADKLKLGYGNIYLNMHSVHLYEKHWELTNAIIIDNYIEENGF